MNRKVASFFTVFLDTSLSIEKKAEADESKRASDNDKYRDREK